MPKIVPSRPTYRHGDLRAALLLEARRVLETYGIERLTLRGIARGVGVSHTASNNDFGDLTGLLTELAAIGFCEFSSDLADAMRDVGEDPRDRMKAMGRAYVGFARSHPGLFTLMFRSARLDQTRPSLRAAIDRARSALRAAASARAPVATNSPLEQAAQAAALWSLVHGFATLLVDGRLDGLIQSLPGSETADTLLAAVLATARVGG